MKTGDHALQRLFRAAARGGDAEAAVLSPDLESQLLRAFGERLSRPAPDELAALIVTIRRGLVAAALIALVTAVLCHHFEPSSIPAMDSLVMESVP
jgi:hypothetical protein